MSRRRELTKRIAALSDIAGIMSAMKGLALMEIRILTEFMASQRRLVAGIEQAAADFLPWHSELAGLPRIGRELCVLVGSEQGFCGDFNEGLLARVEILDQDQHGPVQWVVVGQRLANRMGERDGTVLSLPGAIIADEVPAVLLRLTGELNRLLAGSDSAGYRLSALYHCDDTGEIRRRPLLPLSDVPPAESAYPYPAALNLKPPEFLTGLTGHYLHAALNEVLYSSLMVENKQRQGHMDHALQRLDEETARLKLSCSAERQEEITEEIEIILLSSERKGETDR